MKKYTILSVFILSFILVVLAFNATVVSAQTSTSSCTVTDTLTIGSTGEQVACLQKSLGLGVVADGKFGLKTKAAVISWQASKGLVADGIFGAKSRSAFVGETAVNPNAPVISGVSGPQTLNVNQTGTWTVTASSPTGGNLSYSVFWGDEYASPRTSSETSSAVQQSATFTHSYSRAGVFRPTFTVTDTSGQSAKTSLTVKVSTATVTRAEIISGLCTTISSQYGNTFVDVSSGVISYNGKQLKISATPGVTAGANTTMNFYAYTYDNNSSAAIGTAIAGSNEDSYFKNFAALVATVTSGPNQTDPSTPYNGIIKNITNHSPYCLTVLSPEGGETWSLDDQKIIKWQYPKVLAGKSVKITVTLIAADTSVSYDIYQNLNIGVPPNNPSYGEVSWSLLKKNYPYGGPVGKYKVNVIAEYIKTGIHESYVDESGLIYVSPSTTSSITILSPNGREKWKKGGMQEIKWQDTNNISTHEIKLSPPCVSTVCTVYTLANTQGSSYKWEVGKTLDGTIVPNGQYVVQVCQTGTSNCDSSDTFFDIVGREIITTVPTITSILPPGCTSSSGYSSTNGFACTSAVKGDTVTINGSNFSQNNYVATYNDFISGDIVTLPTDFRSSSMLSAVIPFINVLDGPHQIFLKDKNDRNFISNAVSLNFINPSRETSKKVLGVEAFKFTQKLQKGSSGSEVIELQKFLNQAGYDCGATDGKFGAMTESAVIKFQTANGLTPDGVVGPLTQALLNK